MRDFRVQEFLRELVVSVMIPSDLAGSILVKIFHCSEGRDVECHAPLLKIRENRVTTKVGDVCTQGEYSTYTR